MRNKNGLIDANEQYINAQYKQIDAMSGQLKSYEREVSVLETENRGLNDVLKKQTKKANLKKWLAGGIGALVGVGAGVVIGVLAR